MEDHDEVDHDAIKNDEDKPNVDDKPKVDDTQHDENKQLDDDKQQDDDNRLDQTAKNDAPKEIAPESAETSSNSPTQISITAPNSTSSNSKALEYRNYSVQSGSLRVYRGSLCRDLDNSRHQVLQGSDSVDHRMMCELVNIAMRILSQIRSRDAMATYSLGVVKQMEEKYGQSTAGKLGYYGNEIRDLVGKWLKYLSIRFPNLYIHTEGPYYGTTKRYPWGTHINNYDPTSAARMSIHSGVFDTMCALKDRIEVYKTAYSGEWEGTLEALEDDVLWAQWKRDPEATSKAKASFKEYDSNLKEMEKLIKNYEIHYERSIFQLGATLAHECFHVLTGFWTGSSREFTPSEFYGSEEGRPTLSEFSGDADEDGGEAGEGQPTLSEASRDADEDGGEAGEGQPTLSESSRDADEDGGEAGEGQPTLSEFSGDADGDGGEAGEGQPTLPKFSGGEAGEWWEHHREFGGSVHLMWNKSDKADGDPYPLDDETMSAGICFLKRICYGEDGSPEGHDWIRISHDYIKDVIENGKSANMIGLKFKR